MFVLSSRVMAAVFIIMSCSEIVIITFLLLSLSLLLRQVPVAPSSRDRQHVASLPLGGTLYLRQLSQRQARGGGAHKIRNSHGDTCTADTLSFSSVLTRCMPCVCMCAYVHVCMCSYVSCCLLLHKRKRRNACGEHVPDIPEFPASPVP